MVLKLTYNWTSSFQFYLTLPHVPLSSTSSHCHIWDNSLHVMSTSCLSVSTKITFLFKFLTWVHLTKL